MGGGACGESGALEGPTALSTQGDPLNSSNGLISLSY